MTAEQPMPVSTLDYPALLRAITAVPDRLDRPSAWTGHIPFATWLVGLVRPRLIVELGVHSGTSYFTFCRAVKAAALGTRCFGVGSLQGDAHADHYSEAVFEEVRRYNMDHYGAFSQLLRMACDEAVDAFPDGSVDFLHIDGLHTYEGVKHDFETWLPKLSATAVVLLHDTNVCDRSFGVWRFWHELKEVYPRHLDFLHGSGLGVLQLAAPASADALGWLDPGATERTMILSVFAARGREIESRYACLQTDEALTEHVRLLTERNHELHGVHQQLIRSDQDLVALRQELAVTSVAARQRDEMLASNSWRVTRPLRAAAGVLRRDPTYLEHLRYLLRRFSQRVLPSPASIPDASTPAGTTAPVTVSEAPAESVGSTQTPAAKPLNVVYISGEAHTPGHYYRVECYADAIRATGARCTVVRIEEAAEALMEIASANVLFIWRAAWSDLVQRVIETARAAGAKVVFDVDDLMFEPTLARVSVIDGIRSQGFEEAAVADLYTRVRRTLQHADLCTVTTAELANYARHAGVPAFVLPNGFDEITYTNSRLAARGHAEASADGLLRLGYAGGSRTHQQDFRQCAGAIAEVLRGRRQVRLVLFRAPGSGTPLVDLDEYPELLPYLDRVEWRDLVPIRDLPLEIARFDINLAPLEPGNPFCEAKSELKFFEAALAGVCTIASATGPFARAIRHGETGYIASTPQEWTDALTVLLDDPALREQIARAARDAVLWPFGAERRVERVLNMFDYLRGGHHAARAFAAETHPPTPPAPMLGVPGSRFAFSHDRGGAAAVTVVVPLYNYAHFVTEALDSVAAQTLEDLDLIVIDDASKDDSLQVACDWAERNAQRFNRLLVLTNLTNSHLGPTRNVGFDAADTLYVFPLDADNRLRPDCLARCLATIRASRAAFAYPVIQQFGATQLVRGNQLYDAARLAAGNYIDAMSMVSKAAWRLVGGYDDVRYGWEDYDFWCRLAERGLPGAAVGGEPIAEYRVHGASMLRTTTDVADNKASLTADFERRHPWVHIELPPAPATPISPARVTGAAPMPTADRLETLLPLLRCPETGQALLRAAEGNALVTADGTRQWPLIAGRPVLFPGLGEPRQFPDDHINNPPPAHVIERIHATEGLVLNLSAGGTSGRLPNVIEVEAGLFRHTDLVADAHRLPFADGVFAGAVALNAFERYAEPMQVASELYRLLQPGGWLLIQTAFLKPGHEAPWPFYNCTREGLLRWLAQFAIDDVRVSENFSPMYALSWLASECETALAREASAETAQWFSSASVGSLVQGWRDASSRDPRLWMAVAALPQESQRRIAAGFELLAHKPVNSAASAYATQKVGAEVCG